MLGGYVLRYLGSVATGESLPDARAKVPGALREVVYRLARRHVVAASFETQHAGDARHVHRLAYLRAARVIVANVDDTAAVVALFDANRRRTREARAGLAVTMGLAGVAAGVGLGIVGWVLVAPLLETERPAEPTPPAAAAAEPSAPEEPVHPLAPVFARALPDYVVALDARSAGREHPPPADVATARAQLLEQLSGEAGLVDAMTGLLDVAEAYVANEEDDVDVWFNRLVRVHDALAQHDVPFYVDAELVQSLGTGRQRVLLASYTVHRRRAYDVGGERVWSLDLTRLDTLNFERSLLGYTRPEVRYALVLMDRVEQMLVRDLLPSIHDAAESVIVRGYEDETGIEWVTDFEQWAHEDLRAEAEALGSRGELHTLAAAVVQRRNGVRDASYSLERAGVRLRQPSAYRYDVDDLSQWSQAADAAAIAAIREAEAALRTAPLRRAWELLHEAIAESIAAHEVQHRLDYEADRLVAVPEVLAQHTGETRSEDRVNERAERANAELSAYLSQIAQRPALARTSLIHVASFAMARDSWRMPEAYAAIALYEALANEAGLEHGDFIRARRIARSEVAAVYGALRQRPAAEISALAATAWRRLYGQDLAEIRAVSGEQETE